MRTVRNIAIAINIIFILWVIFSFIEVNMYNLTNPEAISSFNAFEILIALAK